MNCEAALSSSSPPDTAPPTSTLLPARRTAPAPQKLLQSKPPHPSGSARSRTPPATSPSPSPDLCRRSCPVALNPPSYPARRRQSEMPAQPCARMYPAAPHPRPWPRHTRHRPPRSPGSALLSSPGESHPPAPASASGVRSRCPAPDRRSCLPQCPPRSPPARESSLSPPERTPAPPALRTSGSAAHRPPESQSPRRRPYGTSAYPAADHRYPEPADRRESANMYGASRSLRPGSQSPAAVRPRSSPPPASPAPAAAACRQQTWSAASPGESKRAPSPRPAAAAPAPHRCAPPHPESSSLHPLAFVSF